MAESRSFTVKHYRLLEYFRDHEYHNEQLPARWAGIKRIEQEFRLAGTRVPVAETLADLSAKSADGRDALLLCHASGKHYTITRRGMQVLEQNAIGTRRTEQGQEVEQVQPIKGRRPTATASPQTDILEDEPDDLDDTPPDMEDPQPVPAARAAREAKTSRPSAYEDELDRQDREETAATPAPAPRPRPTPKTTAKPAAAPRPGTATRKAAPPPPAPKANGTNRPLPKPQRAMQAR